MDNRPIDEIAELIANDEHLIECVYEQDEGFPDFAMEDILDQLRQCSVEPDDWHYFGEDGANDRSEIYLLTKAMVERRMAAALREAPNEVIYNVRRTQDGDEPALQHAGLGSDDPSFRFVIADVFDIRGRGTIVTGRVEQGMLRTGDRVEFVGRTGTKTVQVRQIERFKDHLREAHTGDIVGLLVDGLAKGEVQRDDELRARVAP